MATLSLIYPVSLPKVGKEKIKFHEFIPCSDSPPNPSRLQACTENRVAFVEALNSKEVSLPNLDKIATTGCKYLCDLHVLAQIADIPGVPITRVPKLSWRSGVLSGAGCEFIPNTTFKSFRDIIRFEVLIGGSGSIPLPFEAAVLWTIVQVPKAVMFCHFAGGALRPVRCGRTVQTGRKFGRELTIKTRMMRSTWAFSAQSEYFWRLQIATCSSSCESCRVAGDNLWR